MRATDQVTIGGHEKTVGEWNEELDNMSSPQWFISIKMALDKAGHSIDDFHERYARCVKRYNIMLMPKHRR